MNPLSAIRGMLVPEIQAVSTPPVAQSGPIPASELQALSGVSLPDQVGAIDSTQGQKSFGNILGDFVNEVNAKQGASREALAGLQSGQEVPLHQVMIAMEEASISFQLMVEVRNKLLESYQELMRMQV